MQYTLLQAHTTTRETQSKFKIIKRFGKFQVPSLQASIDRCIIPVLLSFSSDI